MPRSVRPHFGAPSDAYTTTPKTPISIQQQIPDARKAAVARGIASCEKQILDGASESLQLLDVTALMLRQAGAAASEDPLVGEEGSGEAMVM